MLSRSAGRDWLSPPRSWVGSCAPGQPCGLSAWWTSWGSLGWFSPGGKSWGGRGCSHTAGHSWGGEGTLGIRTVHRARLEGVQPNRGKGGQTVPQACSYQACAVDWGPRHRWLGHCCMPEEKARQGGQLMEKVTGAVPVSRDTFL